MDDHLTELYQDIILEHNRNPRNEGELDPFSGSAEGFNPLCGDKVTVYVREGEGGVDEIAFVGEGCAISRASASIMTKAIKGLSVEDARARIRSVHELLTGEQEPEADLTVLGDLAALVGVRRFPARVKCATMAWHTLEAALRPE
ncbi:MAG: Fe-S cluster assembly sulfur transfer protein SufU [Verrucomicrobiales bacterium]